MLFKNMFNQPLHIGDRHPAPDAVIEIAEVTPQIQRYIDRGWGAIVDAPAPAKVASSAPPPPPPPAEDPSKNDATKGGTK